MKKMSVRIAFCAVALLAIGMLVSGVADAKNPRANAGHGKAIGTQNKVTVCHINGKGTYRLITIAPSAVQAHLNHGDARPGDTVGTALVGADCSFVETRFESPELILAAGEWAAMSCPEGTFLSTGGHEPAEATVAYEGAAGLGVGPYPVYTNHSFVDGETGWVVQNGETGQTLTIFVTCFPASDSP